MATEEFRMQELVNRIKVASADLKRLEQGWRPSALDLTDAVTLSNWIIGIEPHTKQTVFWGEAVGHPILGTRHIVTSPILWISKDRQIARTLSRWYRLGEPATLSIEPSTSAKGTDDAPEPEAAA
jgi:hypothetical protein